MPLIGPKRHITCKTCGGRSTSYGKHLSHLTARQLAIHNNKGGFKGKGRPVRERFG